MEEINNQTEILWESLNAFGIKIMTVLPSLLGAFLILLFGWLIAKLLCRVVTKISEKLHVNRLSEKAGVAAFLENADIKVSPAQMLGNSVKWVVLLIAGLMAADSMGWNTLSQEIGKLIAYLPKLFIALIFFIVGTYIAGFVRDFVRAATSSLGLSTGKLISGFVYYFLLIMVVLTALNQMGLDTSIITSNLLVILGTIFLAAAISYGFASQDVLANILASFYARKSFKTGQVIEVDGEKGQIIEVSNISITLKKDNGEKVVIPTKILINSKVKVGE